MTADSDHPLSDDAPPGRIAVWGAGGHGKVVADAIRLAGRHDIFGFLDDSDPRRRGEAFCGATVLGGREVLAEIRAVGVRLMLAIGDNEVRLNIAAELSAAGFDFAVVVHPRATISGQCQVGSGSFIGAGAVVHAGARVGAHVIVNTSAVVEHDCTVDDGVHLAPCSCLAGHAQVGRASLIGAGAIVRDRVHIGVGATVGMGSVVLQDVPAGAVAYGNPARLRRMV